MIGLKKLEKVGEGRIGPDAWMCSGTEFVDLIYEYSEEEAISAFSEFHHVKKELIGTLRVPSLDRYWRNPENVTDEMIEAAVAKHSETQEGEEE